jgi:hypothetical protein
MPILYRRTNILDPYSWTTGSGGIGDFGQNGSTNENERVIGTDPFGNSSVVWESRPNGSADADGGWGNGFHDVDEFSLYRWSVWVKRITSSSGGTNYLGLYGTPNAVIRIDNGNQEGNPYFECSGTGAYTQNVWYLLVGHCFPSNYTGGATRHPDSGRYITSGRNGDINFCNIGGDVKWYPGTTGGYHRVYHYYCGDNTTKLQWFDPRLDKCDGSEPTISDLLNNRQALLESTTVTVEGAAYKTQNANASGGVTSIVGEYKIHRFNSSGTFTLSSSLRSGSIEVEYLIVAGGGGGGMDMGGGGGGGGTLIGNTILTPGSYTITVGGGGTGAPAGGTSGQPSSHQFTIPATSGGNSSFNGLTAIGGGFGGSSYRGYTPGITGGNGGSGGGASGYNDNAGTFNGGSGTSGQGFRGGNSTAAYYSGGGGGSSSAGVDSTNRPDGGTGRLVGILGKPLYFGGGGGGASYSLSTGGHGGLGGGGGGALGTAPGGTGGLEWGQAGGGGSSGTWANTPGGNGGTNTGGGGGGGSHYNANNKGGNGGSGIVIIRYKYR